MILHDFSSIALKDKTNRGWATKITLAIIINFYLLPSFDSECPFTPNSRRMLCIRLFFTFLYVAHVIMCYRPEIITNIN